MRSSRIRTPAAIATALALVAGGWLVIAGIGGGNAPSRGGGVPSVSPSAAPTHRLSLELRHVRGHHLSGRRVPRERLAPAADAVRRVMTELYTDGFVDPAKWRSGFPAIIDLFTLRTRARAHRDLADLTLGPVAAHLDAVQPDPSRLSIRFLVAHHPIVAVASVRFRGTAIAGAARLPIRDDGVYTLRHTEGGWRIASYRVRSHLPSLREVHRKVRRAAGSPELASGTSFILVLGSDARPGEDPTGTRGDSIHIVGVNARRGAVSILGIPRDSFVPIPGVGTAKINSALAYGGPILMVRTVERLTGVPIAGYVATGFAGFQELVNAVGGITVDVPYRMSDRDSGAFFQPGPKHMTGRDALAFSRDRHDVPGGDYGRSLDQGRMLIAALRQLKASVARNPAALLSWIAAGARTLRTDLSVSDMVSLLLSMISLDPGRVQDRVVSGSGAVVGGQDVIRLGTRAHAMFRDFAADAIFNMPP